MQRLTPKQWQQQPKNCLQSEFGRNLETEEALRSLTSSKGHMAEYNREQAKTDAIVVLQNLIEQLRLHHGVPSKSDARAIIREAIMEL